MFKLVTAAAGIARSAITGTLEESQDMLLYLINLDKEQPTMQAAQTAHQVSIMTVIARSHWTAPDSHTPMHAQKETAVLCGNSTTIVKLYCNCVYIHVIYVASNHVDAAHRPNSKNCKDSVEQFKQVLIL